MQEKLNVQKLCMSRTQTQVTCQISPEKVAMMLKYNFLWIMCINHFDFKWIQGFLI